MKIYVPLDAAAKALGADAVAEAIAVRGRKSAGSRCRSSATDRAGMIWLEPLVEVVVDGVRQAFGPMTPADVPALFGGDASEGAWGRPRSSTG